MAAETHPVSPSPSAPLHSSLSSAPTGCGSVSSSSSSSQTQHGSAVAPDPHPKMYSASAPNLIIDAVEMIQTDSFSSSSMESLDLSLKNSGEWMRSQSNDDKPAMKTLWQRIGKQISSVGKGLMTDHTAKVLLREHWLEAADAKHRYGTLLKSYHDIWKFSDSTQNFFYWLDQGDGRDIDLPSTPRSKLESSALQYLEPCERFQYLVSVSNGRLVYEATGELVHTYSEDHSKPSKWIFVVDPKGRLFVAKKLKGRFHHSSFLSGGPAKAAGNLSVNHGILTRVSRSSGHYKPSEEDLAWFLALLSSRGLNTSKVLIEDFD